MTLKLYNMEKGDVLLLQDTSSAAMHRIISIGQSIFSHGSGGHHNVTHAGIYDGERKILEASGGGALQHVPLASKQAGYKYQVFRPRPEHSDLADFAADMAYSLVLKRVSSGETDSHEGFGHYSRKGAMKGMFTRSKVGKGARRSMDTIVNDVYVDRGFYCSNLVVEAYNLASELTGVASILNVDFRKVTPKRLQGEMLSHTEDWQKVGTYVIGT